MIRKRSASGRPGPTLVNGSVWMLFKSAMSAEIHLKYKRQKKWMPTLLTFLFHHPWMKESLSLLIWWNTAAIKNPNIKFLKKTCPVSSTSHSCVLILINTRVRRTKRGRQKWRISKFGFGCFLRRSAESSCVSEFWPNKRQKLISWYRIWITRAGSPG